MTTSNEAFSRVKIDTQLKDQSWATQNPNAVRFEYPLADGTRADYVLSDRNGRSLAGWVAATGMMMRDMIQAMKGLHLQFNRDVAQCR